MLQSEPAVTTPLSGNADGKAARWLGLQVERRACMFLPRHHALSTVLLCLSPRVKVMTDSESSFHAQTARLTA